MQVYSIFVQKDLNVVPCPEILVVNFLVVSLIEIQRLYYHFIIKHITDTGQTVRLWSREYYNFSHSGHLRELSLRI